MTTSPNPDRPNPDRPNPAGPTTTRLDTAQLDRAAGVLLGMACGDALGAPYEFGPPLGPEVPVAMTGGGGFGWEPGEWTDDTSMAIAIAEVSATGADLRTDHGRDPIAVRWAAWSADAKDVGNQTRAVLSAATGAAAARGESGPTAGDVTSAAAEYHDAHAGRSGGNGSLMRTAPSPWPTCTTRTPWSSPRRRSAP